MALPKEWWKQGDLRAGGKGLTGLTFSPDMFGTWGKPAYQLSGSGDSGQMITPWHSLDNPLYGDSNAWSNYQFEEGPDGRMTLVVKSGDKEGTRYALEGDMQTGFTVGQPIETMTWNTNTPVSYYAKAFGPLFGAAGAEYSGFGAGGDASLGLGIEGGGVSGSWGGTGLMGAGGNTAANLASSGLTPEQIQEIVKAEGGYSALDSYGATGAVPFADKVSNIGLLNATADSIGNAVSGVNAAGVPTGLLNAGANVVGPAAGLTGLMKYAPIVAGIVAGIDADKKNGQFTGDKEIRDQLLAHFQRSPFSPGIQSSFNMLTGGNTGLMSGGTKRRSLIG